MAFPRWGWALAGLALAGLAVYALRETLTPILFAFGIAYLLDPLVDRFEARGIPRALGIAILLALTLGALALVGLLVVPSVVREVVAFGQELPARVERLRGVVEPWLVAHGIPVPHSIDELRQLVQPAAGEGGNGEIASRAAGALGAIGEWILGGTGSVVGVIGTVLVVPVFAFYLLSDFDRMTAAIRELVPWRYRALVVDVATEVDQVLGQFVRGQLLVMLILAILYSVAYSIVGIRLAIPIGIVAGLLSFIPYVGGATALILALLMCALSWQGWWQVAGVGVAYGIIQILEGFVITPRIVGEKVGLAAVWVLVALMVGGELFGFVGVLLAVPSAAVAKIFVVRALAHYKESRLYREGGPEQAGALVAMLEREDEREAREALGVLGGQADHADEDDEADDVREPAEPQVVTDHDTNVALARESEPPIAEPADGEPADEEPENALRSDGEPGDDVDAEGRAESDPSAPPPHDE